MRLNLKIWRQAGPTASGRLEDYTADNVSPGMSFLEMLDVVNEGLVVKGEDAIASSPFLISPSLTTSSISRNDMSGET